MNEIESYVYKNKRYWKCPICDDEYMSRKEAEDCCKNKKRVD